MQGREMDAEANEDTELIGNNAMFPGSLPSEVANQQAKDVFKKIMEDEVRSIINDIEANPDRFLGYFEGLTERREDSDDPSKKSYDEDEDEESWEPTEKMHLLDGIPKDDVEFEKWLFCEDGYPFEEDGEQDEDGMDTD